MENKARFAFIGCGAIANKHIAAINRLPNAEVVGAYDKNFDAARTFSEKYSVPAFKSVEEMVDKTNPTFFNILTPSGYHGTNILELAKFKRHFIVEKPLALALDQIDEILTLCDQTGIKLFVVQQNRFNPPLIKTKEALDQNRFGKMVLGTVRVRWCRDQNYYGQAPWRGTWAMDGGVLTNQASHHIDMLIWMMGDVESVMAKIETRLVDIEAEDTGVAILKFRNGALGVIEATTATRPQDLEGSISILGEKGSVVIGGFSMNELTTWNFKDSDESISNGMARYSQVPKEYAWSHTEFFKDVLTSCGNGSKALIDGMEGRKSVELINAMYESAETGQEVALRFSPKKCRLGK